MGIAVLTVLCPDEGWIVELPEAQKGNLHDRGAWKTLELKQAGPNRFELPELTIKPADREAGALCMSVKVWFNEVTNQFDSPFYVHVPDRYALISFCANDDENARRPRHSQNRVKTLEAFKERLKEPIAIELKENRVPWRPDVLVDGEGNVYFHSLIVGRPESESRSTHLRGIWKLDSDGKLHEIPPPDLRRRRDWAERVRALREGRHRALARIAFVETVAQGPTGGLVATSFKPARDGKPETYQVVKVNNDGSLEAIAGLTVGHRDGMGEEARFANITALTVGPRREIYVADGDIAHGSWIRRISPDGKVTTIAGGTEVGFADGSGNAARFFTPSALDLDSSGDLYVADPVNSRVRKISRDTIVSTVKSDATKLFVKPTGVAVGPDDALYVLDGGPRMTRVRKVTTDGGIETLVTVEK